MAIDTETKRKSIMAFGSGDLLPHPDGTISVGDRQTLLTLYFGIDTSLPDERTLYRPHSATPPAGYNPATAVGPTAYFPGSATPPSFYRPENASTPAS